VTFVHLNKFTDTVLDCKNVEAAFCCSVQLAKHSETRGKIFSDCTHSVLRKF